MRNLAELPLNVRVRHEILQAIIEKRFADGRLPPESALADYLGVSRTTVRSALQALERDGLISRRRGIGTLVKPHILPYRLGLHRLIGFSSLLAEWGHKPSVDILMRQITHLEGDWIERLKVLPTETCLVMEKLFKAGGKPALAITDVIPLSSLNRVPSEGEEIPDPIFRFFDLYGKHAIDHAVVEIVPKNASQIVAQKLGMRRDAAFLHLVEVHYSLTNEPMGLSYIDVNDRYVRFDVVRQHG